METLVLGEREVSRLLDLEALLAGLADGFAALSAGEIQAPGRNEVTMADGSFLLGMPGHRPGGEITVKLVSVFEGNVALGVPSHLATICLFDEATGLCRAVMDGTYITAMRTSGAAAVSCRLLARPDASVLTILGAGVQGAASLRLFPLTRSFTEIRIGSLSLADAERLAATDPRAVAVSDFEAAVRTSDVVALTTHAPDPVISPDWIRPGTHISSVGYAPPRGELPVELLDTATLFVELRTAAFAPTPVGCAELVHRDPSTATELGEVVSGTHPGRTSPEEITVYKAMGHVMEDMVAADLVYRTALDQGAGQRVELHAPPRT